MQSQQIEPQTIRELLDFYRQHAEKLESPSYQTFIFGGRRYYFPHDNKVFEMLATPEAIRDAFANSRKFRFIELIWIKHS